MEEFKSHLVNIDIQKTESQRKALSQLFSVLNLLVILPFITFVSSAILGVFNDGKSSVEMGDAMTLFATFILATTLISLGEYAVSQAVLSFCETQHRIVVHVIEDLIYANSRNMNLDYS